MKIFNLNADEWDRTEEREGWRFKDAWVGAHTDAELIGASMYEVEPGNKQGPFHTHHANEEWAIVLRGEPTLRTHEGEQQLRQGDVVAFPRGKEGAHQIRNDTDAPVRVLMLSTLIAPDIVEYLDTGKIGARIAPPPRRWRLVGTLLDEYHEGLWQDAVMGHCVRATLGLHSVHHGVHVWHVHQQSDLRWLLWIDERANVCDAKRPEELLTL